MQLDDADSRARLFRRLAELGIATTTVPYPAHQSVEEGKALRGEMGGQFTKNLLVRDKRKSLFMIVADEDRSIDLKSLHRQVGAKGQLSFARPEQMREALDVEPGALTPLALINDHGGRVQLVLDAGLLDADQLNFHPLVNTESTGIRPDDLLAFIRSCGREPVIVSFD